MKTKTTFNALIAILFAFSFSCYSQDESLIDTLRFEQTTVEEIINSTKQGTKVNTYITKSGEKISIGDSLKIGMPKNNLSDKYVTIQSGKLKGSAKFLMGNVPIKLNTNWSGRELVITEMYAGHLGGGKNQPLGIYLHIGNSDGSELVKGMLDIEVINIDAALEHGEIFTKKFSMSKNDAIKKLKEAKDLLDLGIITLPEYEKKKANLTPIILRNN